MMIRLFLIFSLFPLAARGATYSSTSGHFSDITNALAQTANSGDTVTIPAFAGLLTNTIYISNSVTLQFAGTNSSRYWGTNHMFILSPTNGGPISINDVSLLRSNSTTPFASNVVSIYVVAPLTNGLIVKDSLFQYGSRTIYAIRRCYGLLKSVVGIDQDTFLAIQNSEAGDDGEYEWSLPLRVGTTNSMVLEDCLLTWTSDSDGQAVSSTIYGQEADRITMRYCRFTTTNSTVDATPFDPHGYYTTWGTGSRLYEVYYNQFDLNGVAVQFIPLRGGTFMFWSNTITSPDATPEGYRVSNEGFNLTTIFNPSNQVANSYLWNNTVNGALESALGHGEPGWFNIAPDTGGTIFDGNLGSEWSALYTAAAWSGSSVSYVETSASVLPSYVKNGGDLYRCISSHTSDASTEPGVGASWATVWVQDAWHIYTREPQSGDPLFPYTPLAYPYPGLSGGGGEAPPYNTSANINGNVRVRGRVTIGP